MWEIVGGAEKGGILVRDGEDLSSHPTSERLSTGSTVQELELMGERLHFRRVTGSGPDEGWISVSLKDKILARRVGADSEARTDAKADLVGIGKDGEVTRTEQDVSAPPVVAEREAGEVSAAQINDTRGTIWEGKACCGSRYLRTAMRVPPASAQVEVKPSRRTNTLRVVNLPIARLEARALEALPKCAEGSNWAKQLAKDLGDLMYLGRDRAQRKRVVLFLASLLKRAVDENCDRARNEVCAVLFQISMSLSFQDVETYPDYAGASGRPVVLVAGFMGSHIDDVRPAAQRWASHYGASVIVFSPSVEWALDQADAVWGQLAQLLGDGTDRPLVLHIFSGGGFQMTRRLMRMWQVRLKREEPVAPSPQCLKCVVFDSCGLDSQPQAGSGPPPKEVFDGQWGFQLGCGFALLLYYEACKVTHEEPCVSFSKALTPALEWQFAQGHFLKKSTAPSFEEVSDFFLGVPVLVIASENDFIVPFATSVKLAAVIRDAPNRAGELKQACGADAGVEVVGEDGLGVHTVFFKKTPHVKHFAQHPDVYWPAVDGLASARLG